uniref:Uncharacterized protein n=1 Tax=Oryza punctata TaxID=4537 RepID=A0A0E0LYC6_ORYPU
MHSKKHFGSMFFLVVFLCLSVQGYSGACESSGIQINQTNLGKSNKSIDTSFEVDIVNRCSCTISNLHVNSNGFNSGTTVDPSLFRKDGESYLVNAGKPLGSNGSIKFTYTYDRAFVITPGFWNVDHC